MRTSRLTLGQFAAVAVAALAALLLVVLSLFYRGSRRTVLMASEQVMTQASRRVTERVEEHLGEAERVLEALERNAQLGILDSGRIGTVEASLVTALSTSPRITEATLTYARATGVYEKADGPHDEGDLQLDPESRGQVSVSRATASDDLTVRHVHVAAGSWRADERVLPRGGELHTAAPPALDPTLHATFTVPSQPQRKGRALWSDLAYIEADAALPEAARRRVVSVQKALWEGDRFDGVVRISLLSDRVDELTHVAIGNPAKADPHIVFLCDREGRLISRLGPADHFALLDANGNPDEDGDVRVVAAAAPPQVTAALRSQVLREAVPGSSMVARLDVGGVPYLFSTSALLGGRTQGWLVGIVVPESYYLGELEASGRRIFAFVAVLLVLAAAGGALGFGAMRRDLRALLSGLARLGRFDFAPSDAGATFRDVAAASDSLEQAKTALRALGKYVPIDLVRQLYDARVEPVLGGRTEDITMLFSDVEGFTTISERLLPDRLATSLGAYLEAMTRAVHATGGIIDKYSGDGVMALWNVPTPCAHHARRACETALACQEATTALFASAAWSGLAPWHTRFGIHRSEASVGHYGAPDRMSFTAMGDGVNLASRLESLNKQYGTTILVSDAVEREAREAFVFRHVDRVAVKGKSEGVDIFELVTRSGDARRSETIERYEGALRAYFERRFDDALALLEQDETDAASRVLAERCRRYRTAPPPADWNGVHVATEK